MQLFCHKRVGRNRALSRRQTTRRSWNEESTHRFLSTDPKKGSMLNVPIIVPQFPSEHASHESLATSKVIDGCWACHYKQPALKTKVDLIETDHRKKCLWSLASK